MRTLKLLACLTLLFSVQAQSDEDTLNYLYRPSLSDDAQNMMNRMFLHARNAEFEEALTLSQTLLDGAEPLQQLDPELYGQIMVNHGIVQSASLQYELGLSIIDRGLGYIEQKANPFDKKLINALMAKAITEMSMGQMGTAEDTFRRAQHITHRQDGVYSKEQMIMVNYLTATSLRRGAPRDADTQQLFSLKVAEQAYGANSEDLLPILSRLGSYFASRGSTLPIMFSSEMRMERDRLFKNSISMYDRSIDILEQTYGENDLRLVQPLRGLASARMLQITGRRYAEEALQRSLAIVSSNPDSDPGDHAQALIDLGDLYIITSDARATDTYLAAWEILQASPETRQMANRIFDTPIRLFPREDRVLFIDRMPDAAEPGDALYIDLTYNITTGGRVEGIRVVDRNVPNEQVRMLRTRVKDLRYRPRIEAGEVVQTEAVEFRQLFQLLRPRTMNDDSNA
ncbi:MAG: hypothetical protein JJ934_19285 [Pseudomonadales bacterium]|nr:hypothetical protein [Pseudomonadales bacterium]MBO6565615.1 hypothetical protein [Pseudomonadales bacterium]MBO6594542.1 hypothetical protein [Pseudomonadales bacterium]MBO6659039.1 hypothetical protein [Pseudomonadales bacterium]MBO6701045.1 hypothetical protein [Pseudomonadales bacterium]